MKGVVGMTDKRFLMQIVKNGKKKILTKQKKIKNLVLLIFEFAY